MYIHRGLLLLFLMLFIFAPSLQRWVLEGGPAWYRPFVIWALLNLLVFWAQRRRPGNEL